MKCPHEEDRDVTTDESYSFLLLVSFCSKFYTLFSTIIFHNKIVQKRAPYLIFLRGWTIVFSVVEELPLKEFRPGKYLQPYLFLPPSSNLPGFGLLGFHYYVPV